MKIEKHSNVLPEWLAAFVNVIKEKKTSQAEMQVGNLPTVNWNDNTFYVDVVNDNAVLYNQYGNEVLNVSVHDLGKTEDQDIVSAVDKYLNEHYVVASANGDLEKIVTAEQEDVEIDLDECGGGTCDNDMTFEQELQKVASLEDGLPDEENQDQTVTTAPTGDIPDEEGQEVTASVEEVSEEKIAEEAEVEPVTPIVENSSEEPALETDPIVSEGIENTVGEVSQGIENEVGTVSEGIEDVATDTAVAPVCVDGVCEVPTEEGCCGECDGECKEEEGFVTLASYNRLVAKVANLEKIVKAFTEAQHAYQEIPNDAYDLNSQEIEVQNFNESAELTQKVIDKEHELDLSNMNDRAKLNENFIKDIVNNDKAEQEVVLDEIKNGEETAPETVEEVPAETEVQTEEPVVEEVTEEKVEEAPVEEITPAEQEAVEETTEVSEEIDPELVTLTDEQVDEFAKQVCPFCHEGNLTPIDEADGVIGVNCPKCGKEFAVADEAIYTVK